MQEVTISEFKAKCLALLDAVQKTNKPLRVTRYGKPVADIVPSTAPKNDGSWIGSMKGTGMILGDVVSPVSDESDWTAAQV